MKKTVKKYLLLTFLFLMITNFSNNHSLYAGLFGPSDYEKCTQEKIAVDLKLKYCYKDKVAAENELEQLKRQYKNETANLKKRIADLEGELERVNKELAKCQNEKQEESELSAKRISELEKTLAIMQKDSSSKEKELLNDITSLKKRYEDELAKVRKQLEDERNKYLKEIADLKKKYEDKLAKLQNMIDNLNEELSSLKKLTQDQKNELERLAAQEKELEKQLENEIRKGDIRLKKFHNKLIINIDNRISFDSGSAQLKKEVFAALDKIGSILENYPENLIMVEGHTDTDKVVTGKFRDNWQLSTERALAVLNCILKNKNLDKKRFAAAGYAEFNPIVPNDTAENKALNRRVDIVVIPRVKDVK